MASVSGLSFCPPRLTLLLLTGGIDSTNIFPRQHFSQASFCWFNRPMKYFLCYLSAISFFFREPFWAVRSTNDQSDEESTRQPDQHHRVVLQPPPSLDSGLDSRSVIVLFRIVGYCLSKAMMLIYICLESLLLALSLDI